MKTWHFIFAFIGLQLSACNSGGDKEADKGIVLGKYVFAVVYENYAWGEKKKGIFIDKDGQLYRYDISEMQLDSILGEKSLTTAQMDAYFAVVAGLEETISPQTMSEKITQLELAKDEQQASETAECNDAGTYVYLGFEYDQALDSYMPITLYRTGDFRQENLQAQALELKAWLMEKALTYEIAFELDPDGNNWCSGM